MGERQRFKIQCGDLDGFFWGCDYQDAFIRAVFQTAPKNLGTLLRFRHCRPVRHHSIPPWQYVTSEPFLDLIRIPLPTGE